MRAVLDPNVLVSALLSPHGTPARLLRLWIDGAYDLVLSGELLDELRRVLAYPKIRSRVSEEQAASFVQLLVVTGLEFPVSATGPTLRSVDAADDYLIALAEHARALICSGDRHLLALAGQFPVYSSAEFLSFLAEAK